MIYTEYELSVAILATPKCDSPNCNSPALEDELFCAKCLADEEAHWQEMERRWQERHPNLSIDMLFAGGQES